MLLRSLDSCHWLNYLFSVFLGPDFCLCSYSHGLFIKASEMLVSWMDPKSSNPCSFPLISVTPALTTDEIAACKVTLSPSAAPAWLSESSRAGFPLYWAHQETWMWERSRFPPYHFSTRCLSHNKDVLSWGFAKPVLIINLLLSIEWLLRQSHGKSATWPPLDCARKWEKFGDVSFFILRIKMVVGGDRSEAQHGWSFVLERMFQGLLSEVQVREGWPS